MSGGYWEILRRALNKSPQNSRQSVCSSCDVLRTLAGRGLQPRSKRFDSGRSQSKCLGQTETLGTG